jgi:hypothetical protein
MTPRRSLLAAFAAGALASMFAACTDLSGLSGDAVPISEAGADAAGDAATDANVGSDVQVLVDGAAPDALLDRDGGVKVDASGCTTCDCDLDGFYALTKPGCADAGGPDDCDDFDSRTRPDRGYNETPEEPPRNGDWNCSNGVEKFFQSNINCAAAARGPACDALVGFVNDPKCGATGTFVTCKSAGTPPLFLDGACVVGAQNLTTIQACK